MLLKFTTLESYILSKETVIMNFKIYKLLCSIHLLKESPQLSMMPLQAI